jgi:hypothetical protein
MKPAKKRKPRMETRAAWCGKCKRGLELEILAGVPIDAVIAGLKNARCPRCRAHRCWITLL